jgi:hypothetical protein
MKEYLRVEVQIHLFLSSENDRRKVKNQLRAIIALCCINELYYTLRGQVDRSKSRSGGFGEKSKSKYKNYCLSRTYFLSNCNFRSVFQRQEYLAVFCALK